MADEKDLLKRIGELEEKLSLKDAQLRSVMESLPFVAWLKDLQGRFIYVNDKYLNFIKLQKVEELIGKTDFDIFPKVEAEKYLIEEQEVMSKKKGIAYNKKVDDIWFTTIKFPVYDNKGNVIGTTGIHRDITERVVNKTKYEIENNLLQALLDSIPDTIYFKDTESKFTRVNKAKSLEVGVENPDELVGKSDFDFFSEEESRPRYEDEQRIIKTGVPLINKIEHALDHEGHDHWISTTKCAIRDKDGNIMGLVGISRDITDTKKALVAMEREKEFLQALMDHIQHTIYFKDTECRFTKINKAQARMIGVEKPEDAIGKTDLDFFNTEHAKAAYDDEKEIMRSGIPVVDKVEKLKGAAGEFRWVTATKYPVRDSKGIVTGIVGMSVDITEKVLYEQKLKEAKEKAEESDRLKTAFLSNMSHEIRTPMNGIIGFSNLLRDPQLSEADRNEFLNHINNCGNQLLALIDDIIDISKIEAGQIKIQIGETHVNNIQNEIQNTFNTSKNAEGKSHIELICKSPLDDDSMVVYTDPFRLRQVLSNLIGNAIKFTSEGSVEFGYTILKSDYIQFYVKDSGIGIPKDKQQVIFERFGQVLDPKTIAMNKKGTGLGLAISANLVKILGGELWVESEVGKGATFFFTIPYKKVNNPLTQAEGKVDMSSIDITGKTILIAEDEETNFIYYKEMLKQYGVKILWVKTGSDAIHSVKVNQEIDIVLMDCKMPEMDGLTATTQIKKIRPDLPVIAQTAFAMADERQKCIEMGCDAYISKPILKEELFRIFWKYLIKK